MRTATKSQFIYGLSPGRNKDASWNRNSDKQLNFNSGTKKNCGSF